MIEDIDHITHPYCVDKCSYEGLKLTSKNKILKKVY